VYEGVIGSVSDGLNDDLLAVGQSGRAWPWSARPQEQEGSGSERDCHGNAEGDLFQSLSNQPIEALLRRKINQRRAGR